MASMADRHDVRRPVTQLITVGIGLDDWGMGRDALAKNPEYLKEIVTGCGLMKPAPRTLSSGHSTELTSPRRPKGGALHVE